LSLDHPGVIPALSSSPGWTCLALVGPTAAGKSRLAMALAQRWPIEIISMDSALVYQGMDVGTAKPSKAEMAQVPHHLIDVRALDEVYSAAEFAKDATRLIQQIRQRHRIPVLVGGTLLYFKALSEGLDEMPPSDPVIRDTLAQEGCVMGWAAMHEQLARVDPLTSARLAPADSQRISRALEVWRITGKPLSSFQSKYKLHDPLTQEPERGEGQLEPLLGAESFLMLSLEPTHRAWLHEKIHLRFQAMLEAGFLQEVQSLLELTEFKEELPSMKSVGYRQAIELCKRLSARFPEVPQPLLMPNIDKTQEYQDFVELAQIATRQLAKRQLTWLRSLPHRVVINCDNEMFVQQALQYLDSRKEEYCDKSFLC
jgi:tRNA dimethylallyltransferase